MPTGIISALPHVARDVHAAIDKAANDCFLATAVMRALDSLERQVGFRYPSKPLDTLMLGDYLAIGCDPIHKAEKPISLACRVTEPTDERGYAKVWVLNGHWTLRMWADRGTHVESPIGPFRPTDDGCIGAEPMVLYIPDEWGQRRLRYKLRGKTHLGHMPDRDYEIAIRWLTDQYLHLREAGELPVQP